MKKDKWLFYLYSLIMLTFIIIFKNSVYNVIGWGLLTLFILYKHGFPRDNSYLKNNVIRIIIISLLSYFLVTYGLGLITGFGKFVFSLKLITVIKNISIPFIFIGCQEIIRYVYAKNCQNDMKPYIFLTFVYIFLNIIIEFNRYNFYDLEVVFKFICSIVLPLVAEELLYSYITYKVSYMPTLIMKLVLSLYVYILPIFPNLGFYLNSVFGVLYPFLIYMMVSNTINHYDKSSKYIVSLRKKYLLYPVFSIFIFLIVLISGVSGYKLIAIGSGSMIPVYNRGDAIIYKKNFNFDEIDIGTIIAYEKNNVIITHRVFEIKYSNNKRIFITKGDNNNNVDEYDVTEEMIRGIVIYKLSYIGYPTIWINEQFNNL